jgi:hypothetical protein
MALPMRRTIDAAADTTADLRSSSRWDPLSELEQLNRRLAGYLDSWRQALFLLAGLFTPTGQRRGDR